MKPILQSLNRQKPQKVPFWFMRQAGRYLPEYRELRAKKNGFMDMATDPEAACEITMQPIRRFAMDAAIIFSDILVIPYALGQSLDFVAGEGPKLDPVRSAEELKILSEEKFDEKLAPVYEALRLTKSALNKESFKDTALIGFAGAPWTVATYMIEGSGSKDFSHAKRWAYGDPDGFSKLIELLTRKTADYLIAQIKAGAEIVKIFDSWAGALDVDQYRRWVIEPAVEIVKRVKVAHPEIPIIGFPRGSGFLYKEYAEKTGITALAIDPQVPLSYAAQELQSLLPVQGNLDPMCLLAGGNALETQAQKILETLDKGAFIFNLGHGINKDTPVEHVEKLVKIIRDYKS